MKQSRTGSYPKRGPCVSSIRAKRMNMWHPPHPVETTRSSSARRQLGRTFYFVSPEGSKLCESLSLPLARRQLRVERKLRPTLNTVYCTSTQGPDLIRSSYSSTLLCPYREFVPAPRWSTLRAVWVDLRVICRLLGFGLGVGYRSRINPRSAGASAFVLTPRSRDHPEVAPFHSTVGQDCATAPHVRSAVATSVVSDTTRRYHCY